MSPQVADPHHERFLAEIVEELTNAGYIVTSSTYHDTLDPHSALLLSRIDSPTTLYIRTRSDRLAFHPRLQHAIQFEVKTSSRSARSLGDWCLEGIPLAHHVRQHEMGVNTVYFYRDVTRGYEIALDVGWLLEPNRAPTIRRIYLTSRYDALSNRRIEEIMRMVWPGATYLQTLARGGSGDPFVVIEEFEFGALPKWRDYIASLVDDVGDVFVHEVGF